MNPVSMLKEYEDCVFQTGLSQFQGVPWAVSAVASGWWGLYGGDYQPGRDKGTGTGKTESFPLLSSIRSDQLLSRVRLFATP